MAPGCHRQLLSKAARSGARRPVASTAASSAPASEAISIMSPPTVIAPESGELEATPDHGQLVGTEPTVLQCDHPIGRRRGIRVVGHHHYQPTAAVLMRHLSKKLRD